MQFSTAWKMAILRPNISSPEMQTTGLRLTLRPAEAGDIEALIALLALLFEIEEDFQADADRQRRGLEMLLDSPQGKILVAEGEGQVIGMCSGQLLISTAEGGLSLLMEDLIVAARFRGHGAGRMLVEAMGEWAAGQGACRLQLLADRNNSEALAFYTGLGWQSTALVCLWRRTP